MTDETTVEQVSPEKARAERMRSELADLEGNMQRLHTFLQGEVVNTLDPLEQSDLRTQYAGMQTYYNALRARVSRLKD